MIGSTLEWLIPEWPAPANVRALSTLRGGGVSPPPYASLNLGDHVADSAGAVAENRRRLRAAAELPAEPSWLKQVHGTHVKDLDAAAPADALPADAAVTGVPGNICAILTADCLPILLASTTGTRIGAIHAGWRGLAGGVIEAAVAAMRTPAAALLAWLGPAIGPGHFEVGPEVRELIVSQHAADECAFRLNARGRPMADLPELARRRLTRLGLTRIYGGGECTFAAGERFFSHRRDGQTGRQATLIWMDRPKSG